MKTCIFFFFLLLVLKRSEYFFRRGPTLPVPVGWLWLPVPHSVSQQVHTWWLPLASLHLWIKASFRQTKTPERLLQQLKPRRFRFSSHHQIFSLLDANHFNLNIQALVTLFLGTAYYQSLPVSTVDMSKSPRSQFLQQNQLIRASVSHSDPQFSRPQRVSWTKVSEIKRTEIWVLSCSVEFSPKHNVS